MRKLLTVISVALFFLSSSVSGFDGTFKQRPNSIDTLERWVGKFKPSDVSVCTDDNHVEVTEISHTTFSGVEKITFNGTGCDVDPDNANLDTLSLAAGWYRFSISVFEVTDTGSVVCDFSLYSSNALVVSGKSNFTNSPQGLVTVNVTDALAPLDIYPYAGSCNHPDATIQSYVFIERINL